MVKSFDVHVSQTNLTAKIMSVKAGAGAAAAQALYLAMQGAFRESQKQVPVKTGVLKNSGQLKEPEILGPGRARVAITYGGAATKYAAEQHDNVTLNHPNGGKAHFVIDPVRAAEPAIRARLKQAIAALGKG